MMLARAEHAAAIEFFELQDGYHDGFSLMVYTWKSTLVIIPQDYPHRQIDLPGNWEVT